MKSHEVLGKLFDFASRKFARGPTLNKKAFLKYLSENLDQDAFRQIINNRDIETQYQEIYKDLLKYFLEQRRTEVGKEKIPKETFRRKTHYYKQKELDEFLELSAHGDFSELISKICSQRKKDEPLLKKYKKELGAVATGTLLAAIAYNDVFLQKEVEKPLESTQITQTTQTQEEPTQIGETKPVELEERDNSTTSPSPQQIPQELSSIIEEARVLGLSEEFTEIILANLDLIKDRLADLSYILTPYLYDLGRDKLVYSDEFLELLVKNPSISLGHYQVMANVDNFVEREEIRKKLLGLNNTNPKINMLNDILQGGAKVGESLVDIDLDVQSSQAEELVNWILDNDIQIENPGAGRVVEIKRLEVINSYVKAAQENELPSFQETVDLSPTQQHRDLIFKTASKSLGKSYREISPVLYQISQLDPSLLSVIDSIEPTFYDKIIPPLLEYGQPITRDQRYQLRNATTEEDVRKILSGQ